VLLPFTLPYSQVAATCLSIVVTVVTLLDTILVPREKWKLNTLVANQLWVEEIKRNGDYEKHKNEIEEILRAENAELELATSLQSLLEQIQKQQAPTPKKAD
jgi:phytoene dehydrogenase-like protein